MDFFRKLSIKAKLVLSFAILNFTIVVVSVFSVVSNYGNINTSYNVERILNKSYNRVINTQQALERADNAILEYLQPNADHNRNEAFIADAESMISEISRIAAIMNENVIGDLPSPEAYKKHIIGLNDDTMYVIEDLGGAKVNKYKYEVNYIPESIIPFTITNKE